MMTLFNIYFAGAYITCLLFAWLLEFDTFRSYIDDVIETAKQTYPALVDVHNYTIMIPAVMLVSLLSWFGLLLLVALIFDFTRYGK